MGRFSYIRYDDEAVVIQGDFKARFESIERAIEANLSSGRAKALALTALEECYMWIGKQIRDDQISRGGSNEEQPERNNE